MAWRNLRRIEIKIWDAKVGTAVTWAYPADGDNDSAPLYEIPTYKITVSGKTEDGRNVSRDFEAMRFGVYKKRALDTPHVVGITARRRKAIRGWYGKYTVHSADSPEKGAWIVHGNYLIHDGPDKPKDSTEPYASAGCVEICGGPFGFVTFNDFILSLSGSKKSTRQQQLNEIGWSGKMFVTYVNTPKPPLKVYTPTGP